MNECIHNIMIHYANGVFISCCKVAIFECLQLLKRRGTAIKGDNEAKARKMLSPKCMSDKESDLDEISKESILSVLPGGDHKVRLVHTHTHTHTTHMHKHMHMHSHTHTHNARTHTQKYLIYI